MFFFWDQPHSPSIKSPHPTRQDKDDHERDERAISGRKVVVMNCAGESSEAACRWMSAATAARYVESRAWECVCVCVCVCVCWGGVGGGRGAAYVWPGWVGVGVLGS